MSFVQSDEQHCVTTPNPEMIVAAQKNPEFMEALTRADLALPDGSGIVWALKRRGFREAARITGTDMMEALCMQRDFGPVFLLGAREGVADEAARALARKNPSLRIAGTFAGSPDATHDAELRQKIVASGARAIFVAYGAPAQELWIARNLPHLPHVRLAMGIGGAFDFLAGRVKRAPKLLRSLHLEWLWRLILQPWRIRRIFTAVVVFPLRVISAK